MYFLENFKDWKRKNIEKSFTIEPRYFYWCNTLLEYAIRLFEWHGLPESVPPHEIEFSTLSRGFGVVVKLSSGEWIAPFNYSREGITNYYDIFTHVNFSTPLTFGKREFGKTAVIVPNNRLKMSLMPKIQSYAIQLAHIDISIVCETVNDRQSVLFEAINNGEADKMNTYIKRLYKGEMSTIVNKGLDMIKTTDLNKRSNNEIAQLITARNELLTAYLEEIGVRKSPQKRERMISDEVGGNDELLMLNLSDMLECRQKSAEKMSELMNREITVTCNIDYLKNSEKIDIEVKEE